MPNSIRNMLERNKSIYMDIKLNQFWIRIMIDLRRL